MTTSEKLQLIYQKLNALNSAKFKYNEYISSTKKKKDHVCPTVCCVVGWFPVWFPNAGFSYVENEDGTCFLYSQYDDDKLKDHLSKLLNLSNEWVDYLFYGHKCPVDHGPKLNSNSSLKEVKKAFLFASNYFKNNLENEFPYFLS